jgi:hypothetical protein
MQRDERGTVVGTVLLLLFLLAVLAAAADFAMRFIAEGRIARSIRMAVDLDEDPDVELRGFPFVFRVLEGRFERVDVDAALVEVEGLALEEVHLDFRSVRFPKWDLVSGGTGDVSADGGTAVVEVTDEAFSRFLADQGVGTEVVFTPGSVAAGGGSGSLEIDGGVLAFRPQGGGSGFEVSLPQLMPGLTYRRVTVDSGFAVIRASLAGVRFRLAE